MSGTLGAGSRVVLFRGPMRVVRRAVADDPMVRSGTVTASIQPFDVERSRARITPALLAPDGKDAREPFTLGGPNKESPIRIEDERASRGRALEAGAGAAPPALRWRRVRFDHPATDDFPYMVHCHILEHEDMGMMGQFTVT